MFGIKMGNCGSKCTWGFRKGVLTISGNGAMDDCQWDTQNKTSLSPWCKFQYDICAIQIQNGITRIGDYAFADLCKLTEIQIPDSVTSIGSSAFLGCSGLNCICINGVKSIGNAAFSGCSGLRVIYIPKSVTSIGDSAFAGCSRDTAMKLIRLMQSSGYRVWYDEGINPGTEYRKIITAHVTSCKFFISLISDEYLESEFCGDEIFFAKERQKKQLLVYLEDIILPDDWQLAFNRLQAMHYYTYASDQMFLQKFERTVGIDQCREG